MPRLPDVAAQGERQAPLPASGLAVYDPVNWRETGIAGNTIAGGGRELEAAANTLAATNERQDEIVARAAANNLAQARIQHEFGPQGFTRVLEGNAVGPRFIDEFSKKFADAQTQLSEGLVNQNQRRIFEAHAAVQGLQYKSALLAHQAKQTEIFNDATDRDSISLALRQVATQADKDVSIGPGGDVQDNNVQFKLQMAQIEGTIESMAQRKGLPEATVKEMKAKMTDAAWSTRIKTIMDGIPGTVQANPYLAEKLYQSVQGQLGDVSRLQLGEQVQKAVKNVQQREWADYAVFGGPARALPSTLVPAIANTPPLLGIVRSLESGGNMLAVSTKGARSDMQVMPYTATNPGFGVRPAQPGPDGKLSLEELHRVGVEYLGAMTARYGNPALILAAYNAGPGAVDGWITKYGDPRAGQISTADWVAKIPFDETRKYVASGLQKAGVQQPDATNQPLTANQLKTQALPLAQAAYQHWLDAYPNDVQGAEAIRSRVLANANLVIGNQQAKQAAANDVMQGILIGSKPDGSDAPQTFDQFYNNPAVKQAWNDATPEVKAMYQKHFENPTRLQRSDPKLVNELSQRIFLPEGDPQKISTPGQITELTGRGLNYTDTQHMLKLLQESNTPEGNPFLKQVSGVKARAHKMLTATTFLGGVTAADKYPDIAEEAAYRFAADLDQKIAAARKAGVDPQTLFTPGSKDYVLDPNRVAAFMPSEAQIMANKARAPAQPPVKITSDAEFNALPKKAMFIGPDGKLRQKP